MKQLKYSLLILTLLIGLNVLACLNEYRTLLTGEVIETSPVSGRVWT